MTPKSEGRKRQREARKPVEAAIPINADFVSQSETQPEPSPRVARPGQFLPGHFAALKHGLQTTRLPPQLEHLAEEIERFESASVADDGGAADVPTRRRSLHHYRARVHRRILLLDSALELKGLTDNRGKLRQVWLTKLETLIKTALSIDNQLGLDRRARHVGDVQDHLKRNLG